MNDDERTPERTPDRAPAPDHRSGPRRRGDALRAAIVEAVMDELAESGYDRLTLDGVAARARVSKASLYRRWPGKPELVVDAVYTTLPIPAELRDTGTLRGDLLALFDLVARTLTGPSGHALKGLISETLRDADIAERFRARSQGRGIQAMRSIVDRAVARGELERAALPERRLETGHNLLRHEFLLNGAVTPEFVTSLVDDVVVPLLTHP
ncbi:TetR/AcrR family transcriptional regulator [Agromyces laixinhei]|uniref:TetR/AcrR family transcriptional regulator n=1 Tax=Agromyces laixinhei TaxID=2585717 RepID=UPI0018DC85EB|nr:TetR/AcrR family transcriptional regulator [Agromyces laixinhei]